MINKINRFGCKIKIISGNLKGRYILTNSGYIRPTASKIREAIFSVIGKSINNTIVLDLFAGTGAFGIEAISRGAKTVVFVEYNIKFIRSLKNNINKFNIQEKTKIFPISASKALKNFKRNGLKFDFAFIDPPYNNNRAIIAARELDVSMIMKNNAIVIVEHSSKDSLPNIIGTLEYLELRRYGDTSISFYIEKY